MSDDAQSRSLTIHWRYAAATLANHLDAVIRLVTTDPGTMPRGPYLSIRWLLDDGMIGARDVLVRSPHLRCRKHEIFLVVAKALRPQLPNALEEPEKAVHLLEEFYTRLERLPCVVELSLIELATARAFASFLHQLVKDGDAAAYAEHMVDSHAE